MKERDVEKYLVDRIKAIGGEVRKVRWVGRKGAPDRLVMLPGESTWVEVKSPATVVKFPNDARERAQYREHRRMRKMGLRVELIGTTEMVDYLFPIDLEP